MVHGKTEKADETFLPSRKTLASLHFSRPRYERALDFQRCKYKIDVSVISHPTRQISTFHSVTIQTYMNKNTVGPFQIIPNRKDSIHRDRKHIGEFIFLLAAKLKYDLLCDLPDDKAGFLHSNEIYSLCADGITNVPSSIYRGLNAVYRENINRKRGSYRFLDKFLLERNQLWHLLCWSGRTGQNADEQNMVWWLNVENQDITFRDEKGSIIPDVELAKSLGDIFPKRCLYLSEDWERFSKVIDNISEQQQDVVVDGSYDVTGERIDERNEEYYARDWKSFAAHSKKLLQSSISRLAHKYAPDVYVNRKNIEDEFEEFLTSTKNLFLILGKSGVGKTNLMCNLAVKGNCPGLFVSGDLYPVGKFLLEDEIRKHLLSLPAYEVEDTDVVKYVNDLCLQNKTSFAVYIDALNEFANPSMVVQELSSLVTRWGIKFPSIKFCVSCRTQSWETIMQTAQAPPPQSNLYSRTKGGNTPKRGIYQADIGDIILDDFDEQEFKTAFHLYQEKAEFTGNLSSESEELCRHPLLLKLVAQVWAGKELPDRLNIIDLWDSYWNAMMKKSPDGTKYLAFEIASTMKQNRIMGISESQINSLPSYSKKRLSHLITAGTLNAKEEKYDVKYTFTYETLFEYTLARHLLSKEVAVLDDVPALLEECLNFPNLRSAVIFLSGMIGESQCMQFLRNLVATSMEGQKLASDIIGELKLSFPEVWDLLKQIYKKVPFAVTYALATIGEVHPEKTEFFFTNLIKTLSHWNFGETHSISFNLRKLCRKNEFFVRLAEKYADGNSRYKQVALITLYDLQGYKGPVVSSKRIQKYSKSRDINLRRAVAFVLGELINSGRKLPRGIIPEMAKDSDKQVRDQLAMSIGYSTAKRGRVPKVLKEFLKSGNRRQKQVAAEAVGYAISKVKHKELYRMAKQISEEHGQPVRTSLLKGMFRDGCGISPNIEPKLLQILESIIVKTSYQDLEPVFNRFMLRIPKQLLKQWYQSKEVNLRICAALQWSCNIDDFSVDVAICLAKDTSARVRLAVSKGFISFRWQTKYLERAFQLLKILLADKDRSVRLHACRVVSFYLVEEPVRGAELLIDRLSKEDDEAIKCKIMQNLITVDTEENTKLIKVIDKRIDELTSAGNLTDIGLCAAYNLDRCEFTNEFLYNCAQKDAEPYQHIASVGYILASLMHKEKSLKFLEILLCMIQNKPCRAHLVALEMLSHYTQTKEFSLAIKENAEILSKLLSIAVSSSNEIVRCYAVHVAWRCLAFYPDCFKDQIAKIINKVIDAKEWKVRFFTALYAASLNDSKDALTVDVEELASRVIEALCNDSNPLVGHATAFAWSQLEGPSKNKFSKLPNNVNASFKNYVKAYSKNEPDKHCFSILAKFYLENVDWISDELEYEIDALQSDGTNLLFAMWQRNAEKTEKLAQTWKESNSAGLNETAINFFKKIKSK